jgi:hypothetical protein
MLLQNDGSTLASTSQCASVNANAASIAQILPRQMKMLKPPSSMLSGTKNARDRD